jgi:pimeloyl-ACP methyl ester carboxylesterase
MIEELTMPVTLLRGMAQGSVVDDEDEAEFRRRSPHAAVVHVEGAGHSIQGDAPVMLAGLLDDFCV